MVGKRKDNRTGRAASYWLLGLGWILLSLALLILVLWLGVRQATLDFQRHADTLHDTLLQRMRVNEVVLAGFAAHFAAHSLTTEPSDQAGVQQYAQDILERYPRIYQMQAQAKVAWSDLEEFEWHMRISGHPSYRVRTFTYDTDRSWRDVIPRPFHYPVFFVEPVINKSTSVLGLDAYSVAHLRAAIQQVARTGEVTSSAPFELVEGGRAYVLFRPVKQPAVAEGNEALSPSRFPDLIVSLVIRTQELVPRHELWPAKDITLYQSSFPADDRDGWLYRSSAVESSMIAALLFPRLTYSRPLDVEGQPFVLRIRKQLTWNMVDWPLLLALTAFLLITFLVLTFYVRARKKTEEQRDRTQRALAAEHDLLNGIMETAVSAVVVLGPAGEIAFANQRAEEILDLERDRSKDSPHQEPEWSINMLNRAPYADVPLPCREVIDNEVPVFDLQHVIEAPDAPPRVLSINAAPLKNEKDAISGIVCSLQDITARKRAEEALRESEGRFKDFADTAADWFWETDSEHRFTYLSGRFQKTMGIPPDKLLGETNEDFVIDRIHDVDELENWGRHFKDIEARRAFEDFQFEWLRPDGKSRILRISGKPIFDAEGTFRGYRGAGRDVTTAHRLSQQIAHRAAHDSLTGLVNRREFNRRLLSALSSAAERGTPHALCYLDLDRFKAVNDAAGHQAGDELLKQLAELLPNKLRRRDTLARLGGDEFSLLLENCPLDKAIEIGRGLVDAIRNFRFRWRNRDFEIGVSIGLVPIIDKATRPTRLLEAADAACYRAKRLGGNRVYVASSTSDTPSRRRSGSRPRAELETTS